MVTEVTDEAEQRAPVFAGQGRGGQRIAWAAAVLVTPGAVVVPALLVRAGLASAGVCLLALFAPLLGPASMYLALRGRHARLTAGGLLTAGTVSGTRTVDLARLVRVRRIELRGRGRATDRLVLTDAHGVRLAVDRLAGGGSADRAVAAAVASAAAPVAVSRHAGRRLERVSAQVPAASSGRQALTRTSTRSTGTGTGTGTHSGTHAGPRATTPGLLRSLLLLPVAGLALTALGIGLLFVSLLIADGG